MQDNAAPAIVQRIAQALGTLAAAPPGTAAALDDHVALCREAMQLGRAAAAIPLLRVISDRTPRDASVGQLLAFALRDEQRYGEARDVFASALAMAPHAPGLRFGLAQTSYELGLPAAALFAEAQAALPGNLEIVRNRAAAMASEGDREGAEQLLRDTLRVQPGWLDGHKGLATLRWTGGDTGHFADSYAEACKAEPGNAALWTAWFGAVAQSRAWPASTRIIDQAERQLGATPTIMASRLFIACESGDQAAAEALLPACADIRGDTVNLCRIRLSLRLARFDEAQALLLPLTSTPGARLYWPYLSLVWRALDDRRHLWLDNPGGSIRESNIGLTGAELAELAEVLRALHAMDRPYIEQTVRGGTQTDRSVLLRHEPILQRTRACWMAAIGEHIAALPGYEAGHPLLGTARQHLLLGGSWSVRLAAHGHNVPHTHPMGWMSSSLYVAVPGEAQRGPPPAGHITFGAPPPELGLDLPAYRTIAPEPGMVVTFPSTTWHAVVPFADGERLMIALDISQPQY